MYDYEELVGDLLQQRPELTRDELKGRIEEKKKTVGAGYLTDQGALFLVAGELGVSLKKQDASSDMRIGDLYIGANDVTVVARVLSVYPEATFNKKAGGTGKYRRLALFDGATTVKMTVWEEALGDFDILGLAPDAVVRVTNAYVKQGLDGKPNVNLGRRGGIEKVSDEKVSAKLPGLSAVAVKLPKLSKEEQFVAIDGVVSSEPRFSEFVRSDGSGGSLFQFGVDSGGGKETRVVVWSPTERPELKRGQRVRISNVRARRSNSGDFEVHGDAGSAIEVGKAEKSELRVAAMLSKGGAKRLLGVGKDRAVKLVELGKEVREPSVGEVVEVSPDDMSEGRLYCRSEKSLRVLDGDAFPDFQSLATKLKDVKMEDAQVMVEVIALSKGTVDDVTLRDGSTVKKGELVVGDDTSEIKIVAWRELSGRLSGIEPGERLRVVGALEKSTKMGAWVLQLSGNTEIEKLRGPV